MAINIKYRTSNQAAFYFFAFLIITFAIAFGMGVAWLLLWAWNLLAVTAGWAAIVPISWKTVAATMVILAIVRSISSRSKN
ncbi:hypothetical protein GC087_21420 [Pantoea sp. JZ2]|uniref:hypothetical protein n=1 Tax=Pantoea sp. JZ2 TaxID=2654189 RepID=UPI002B47C596|nr:hypothetical protein [Pantoea sp. JZ2]WRH14975.1 hypothetical protein GC087_21420 [Pantoea sp. JZ2]